MSLKFANLEKLLEIIPLSASRFIIKYKPEAPLGGRGTFGGTLVAQSLLASLNTIPRNFIPVSLHCYFIKNGDPHGMIEYEVSDLRRGNNYIHKQINAYQFNRLIFSSMVLFSRENITTNIKYMKEVNHPRDHIPIETAGKLFRESVMENSKNLEVYQRYNENFAQRDHLLTIEKSYIHQPLEYRFPRDMFETSGARHRERRELDYHVRIREDSVVTTTTTAREECPPVGTSELISPRNDVRYNYVAFAYLSDSYLLLTLPYFLGLPMFSHRFSVSLDHSIHFHQLPSVNRWLHCQLTHSKSHSNRHTLQCEHYDAQSGQIVASVGQEGLVVYPNHAAAKL